MVKARYAPMLFRPRSGGLLPEQLEVVRALGRARASRPANAGPGDGVVAPLSLAPDTSWLFSRLYTLAVRAAHLGDWGFELEGPADPLQYRRYRGIDDAKLGWHVDIGKPTSPERKVTVLVQISDPDEYEGGDLELFFRPEPWQVPREAGTAVVFPSFLLHRVTPVRSGERHSLVGWVCGPPLR